jgi:DNA-binding protein YbaB
MNNLSTKDLNRLRSQSKIIVSRVEIFIETYLSETSLDEDLVNETLQEIIKAANNLTTAASKMKTAETVQNLNGSK